ncbi:carboxyl-terminal processing protease [Parabacteroides sp. PF5-5]|uniref:S41 family peptidase n=1 Tax=unclassified Parabacteroides TaxID=2649774 RepID=UPI0024759A6D|nr:MULTISPECIES: S41 family peptidase [unclassified Parabacteroides]MDH6306248.1 carboxyl-terminal processing protease [Parabacteroides sp. PH5-39]MDH6316960.1 carboxyl-terminal processing protease [Parabacteroides sp. PF5-13]MDH6321030.1 carboxyl-terminal processing protease [Parabacteroides sp. PH5-13]MDH6324762.1 carboxyl-terminal processing protease [Parabacteroides sp. PH5-8]MDH6328145.1 carboxyl-terminal processing protease [Parabacteroides sp. PH5-41]
MKAKRLFFILSVCFVFFGCSSEETPEEPTTDTVNSWIEETMRRYYFWYDEIPDSKRLNSSAEPEAFFYSLLSRKDGKNNSSGEHYYYSSINKKSTGSKANMGEGNSFGFEFQAYNVSKLKKYALLVLYVLPSSPADKAGIKRGDWIFAINNADVPGTSSELISLLLDKSSSKTLKLGFADVNEGTITRSVDITSRPVTDNPVFTYRTIPLANGKNAAYLLYNHFTAGPGGDEDQTYNNKLRTAFSELKTKNPTDFILDLRYNGGGLVSSARLMATMLAPESALSDIFCKLTYNGKSNSYSNQTLYLDPDLIKQGTQGANLNIKRLYVITSTWTASASEAVINGLEPYVDELILIGAKTEGKNVGSVTFSDDKYEWELHPIVSTISNKKDFSDYSGGFEPTFPCVETYQDMFYELGDEREFMLKQVLNYINYQTPVEDGTKALRSSDTDKTLFYSSIERKSMNSVILNP